MGRPGQVLRDDGRLIALGDPGESLKMRAVQRFGRTDRQANAVQRERIAFADRLEPPVWRTAGAHIVLSVDFEEAEIRAPLENGVEMFGLEANADAAKPWATGL